MILLKFSLKKNKEKKFSKQLASDASHCMADIQLNQPPRSLNKIGLKMAEIPLKAAAAFV